MKNTFISQKPEPSGVPQAPENGSSGHGIRLTGSSLACGVFLLLVAMPLAYMTGVMVGRDNPLQPLPAEVAQSDRTSRELNPRRTRRRTARRTMIRNPTLGMLGKKFSALPNFLFRASCVQLRERR